MEGFRQNSCRSAPWSGEAEISVGLDGEPLKVFKMDYCRVTVCDSPHRVEPRPFASVAKGLLFSLFEYTGLGFGRLI